jgi:OmpA-OmpF porin, OOP family
MRNSERAFAFGAVLLAVTGVASLANAQQQVQGFAVERLYPSAPGGGWFVMDDLSMRGGLGGDVQLTGGYAYKPLRVTDGTTHLPVVQDEASTDFGFAATYDRWRVYLNLDVPVLTQGQGGIVGAYQLTAPSVDPGSHPDSLSDARLGVDGRLVGAPGGPFRLGAGAQLFVPEGSRADYDSDGTVRAMLRVLFAGDVGSWSYAGQLGVHIRPLDDAPAPGSPRGSELLFGVAAGPRFIVGSGTALVVGPEVYGQSAFQSFLGKDTTGVEGLLSARMEGTADDGGQLRVKLGAGGGLDQHFGAPEWRIVLAVELFDHSTDRDHDGVTDSKDACPDVPGIKTKDPKTNGCPAGTTP